MRLLSVSCLAACSVALIFSACQETGSAILFNISKEIAWGSDNDIETSALSDAGAPKRGLAAREPCGSNAVVDDADDGNGTILPREGRTGRWHALAYPRDDSVSAQIADARFEMARDGDGGSRGTVHLTCGASGSQLRRCALELDLLHPRAPYDASRYGGIAFSAKGNSGTKALVRFGLPDANTDSAGERCGDECGSHFGASFRVTDTWADYELAFDDSRRAPGAVTGPRASTPAYLYGLRWEVPASKQPVDILIDNVRFIGCSPDDETTTRPPGPAVPTGTSPRRQSAEMSERPP
jgi:hypothetical protein